MKKKMNIQQQRQREREGGKNVNGYSDAWGMSSEEEMRRNENICSYYYMIFWSFKNIIITIKPY